MTPIKIIVSCTSGEDKRVYTWSSGSSGLLGHSREDGVRCYKSWILRSMEGTGRMLVNLRAGKDTAEHPSKICHMMNFVWGYQSFKFGCNKFFDMMGPTNELGMRFLLQWERAYYESTNTPEREFQYMGLGRYVWFKKSVKVEPQLSGSNGEWTNGDDMALVPVGGNCGICQTQYVARGQNGRRKPASQFTLSCGAVGARHSLCTDCLLHLHCPSPADSRNQVIVCPFCRHVTHLNTDWITGPNGLDYSLADAQASLNFGNIHSDLVRNRLNNIVAAVVNFPAVILPPVNVVNQQPLAVPAPPPVAPVNAPLVVPPAAPPAHVAVPPGPPPDPAADYMHVADRMVFYHSSINRSFFVVALVIILVCDLTMYFLTRNSESRDVRDVGSYHLVLMYGMAFVFCDFLLGANLINGLFGIFRSWMWMLSNTRHPAVVRNYRYNGLPILNPVPSSHALGSAVDEDRELILDLSRYGYTHYSIVPIYDNIFMKIIEKRSGSQNSPGLQRFIVSDVMLIQTGLDTGIAHNTAVCIYQAILAMRAREAHSNPDDLGQTLAQSIW